MAPMLLSCSCSAVLDLQLAGVLVQRCALPAPCSEASLAQYSPLLVSSLVVQLLFRVGVGVELLLPNPYSFKRFVSSLCEHLLVLVGQHCPHLVHEGVVEVVGCSVFQHMPWNMFLEVVVASMKLLSINFVWPGTDGLKKMLVI